jgi:hypothetical protein
LTLIEPITFIVLLHITAKIPPQLPFQPDSGVTVPLTGQSVYCGTRWIWAWLLPPLA